MALKNRVETSVVIQAQAAVVGETEYKQNLDTDFAQNVMFRKDVSDADTAAAGTKTLDFLDIDYIEVAQSNNVAYTLNNVQQGEIKFLKLTKTANQTVTFVNATDVSARLDYITTLTVVIYRITNKDGDLYLESINIPNDVNGNVLFKKIDIGDWDMDANASPVAQPVHGIGDKDKIVSVQVLIRIDESEITDINVDLTDVDTAGIVGGYKNVTDTVVFLSRETTGRFNAVAYDDTSFNRGFVTIGYLP